MFTKLDRERTRFDSYISILELVALICIMVGILVACFNKNFLLVGGLAGVLVALALNHIQDMWEK